VNTYVYKRVGPLEIRADVHRGQTAGPVPVVVWIHPGTLMLGSRRMLPSDELERLLEAGLTVVAIDYRLAPETKLPAILTDVRDAIGWVRDNGPSVFGADPARVALMGASAGAHLALLTAASLQPPPAAVVSLYGYGDVADVAFQTPDAFYATLPFVDAVGARSHIGNRELSEGDLARYDFFVHCRQAGTWPAEVLGSDLDASGSSVSVEALLTAAMPPTLLLHGDCDVDVPIEMSERIAERLSKAGVEHELIRMHGYNHAFDVFDTYPPSGPPRGLGDATVSDAFDRIVEFLTDHLT
jgi:acetyl esterase/lipase